MMTIPVLDKLLAAATINLEAFAVCEIARDTGLLILPLKNMEVHYVLVGTLHLTMDGAEPIVAPPGTVIVVPPHRRQRLGGSAFPGRELLAESICSHRDDCLDLYDASTGGAGLVRVICGQVSSDMLGRFGLFEGMIGPVVANLGDDSLVRASFKLMLAEVNRPRAYSNALTASLMKACLVLSLRHELEHHGAVRLPAIFQKPWLAEIVTKILTFPGDNYSVDTLAAMSGRSRSTFAKEFAIQVGATPMEFVTQARLSSARALLLATNASVAAIAVQSGFLSRSHFSRLFKMVYGSDPTAFRRSGDNRIA